jgi:two-component system sensor histidine kinase HydH
VERLNRVVSQLFEFARLNQVLLNLYLNALEGMEPGGRLTVALLEGMEPWSLEVRVADTGCGIAPGYLTQVFEPYFTTTSHGTGLGLTIAHNIAQAMAAELALESRPGAGTTFILKFHTN